jgi:small-conductance mechanosensitive channel
MDGELARLESTFVEFLPNLLAALAVLVVGWLIALAIASLVKKLLQKTEIDDRIAAWVSPDPKERPPIEQIVARVVFWVLMVLVVVICLQVLGLTAASRPLNSFLNEVFAYIPRLAAAAALLFVAWLVAKGLKFVVVTALDRTRLDEKLQREVEYQPPAESEARTAEAAAAETAPAPEAAPPARSGPTLASTIGDTVYWLVFLFFLPAVLGTLGLEGLLGPVNSLVQEVLDFLPNLLGALLVLGIGWLIARIVQRIVTNLLAAAGTDRLGDRIGAAKVLGSKSLSGVLGLVVYVLILVPVLISALNVLGIEAVTRPASRMLDRLLVALPQIFAAGLILVLAWVLAKLVASLVESLLSSTGFDGFFEDLGFVGRRQAEGAVVVSDDPDEPPTPRRTPSQLVGYGVLVAVMLFATIEAFRLLDLDTLAALLTELALFLADVLLGLLILAAGLYLANLAARAVRSSGVRGADVLAKLAHAAVVVLAGAMALRQMGVAEDIINLAFGLLLGAVAIAIALAFGIGGRDVAGRYLEKWTGKVERRIREPGSSPVGPSPGTPR